MYDFLAQSFRTSRVRPRQKETSKHLTSLPAKSTANSQPIHPSQNKRHPGRPKPRGNTLLVNSVKRTNRGQNAATSALRHLQMGAAHLPTTVYS